MTTGTWAISLLGSVLMSGIVWAQPASSAVEDLKSRTLLYSEKHVVAEDGTEVSTFSQTIKILKPEVLEALKKAELSYSASAQRLEVLEAYTRKAGGRKIPVPKQNYQVHTASGNSGAKAVYSDWNQTTVVFPDLAVGDEIVLSHKIITRQPLFPGKVSHFASFPRQVAQDLVKVSFDLPAALDVKHAARGMKETIKTQGKRRLIEWTLENRTPVRSEREDYSVYDIESEPGYSLSTFSSYAEVAQRYVERAKAKAAVTPRVRQLAEQLTQGQSSQAEQVRALYEWVAKEITYAGNCVGIGAVVPRDLDFVLDNRMGDCKDHATLLEALLAGKGMESHQVLVNAGNVFQPPAVPVLSLVNHVINYVPAVGLFLDSTDAGMPYGDLPVLVQDKPVLAAASGVPPRTPADKGVSAQHVKTILNIGDDGSVRGRVEVQMQGRFGIDARRQFRTLSKDDAKLFVKRSFAAMKLEAEGTLEHADPTALSDRFDYQADFTVQKMLRVNTAGAFGFSPLLYSVGPIAYFVQAAVVPVRDHPSICFAGSSSEVFEITLPEKMNVLSIPEGVAFNTPMIRYESSYRLDGRILRVQRRIEDKTAGKGNICDAASRESYKQAMEPAFNDLRQQVLHR